LVANQSIKSNPIPLLHFKENLKTNLHHELPTKHAKQLQIALIFMILGPFKKCKKRKMLAKKIFSMFNVSTRQEA
jgi:hypothetical protein